MSSKPHEPEYVSPHLKRPQKDEVINSEDVEVVEPSTPAYGRYYPSYAQDWISWLVSNNPEFNNHGPVYFVHCVSCQQGNANYGTGYGNEPVIKIGPQAININAGEYVFLPVLTSTADAIDTGVPDNHSALMNYVITDLQGGNNPPHPNEATIVDASNGKNNLVPIVKDLTPYFIISDIFTLDVPPAQEGASLLRSCFDIPISTEGPRNCCVGGWWLLLRFKKPNKKYYIHCYSRGRGQYQAGMFHEINVLGESTVARINAVEPKEDWTKPYIVNFVRNLRNTGQIEGKTAAFIERIMRDF